MKDEELNKESTKEVKQLLADLRDSKGINRQVLETRNIKASIDLSNATLKKLKSDVWRNVLYIFIGAILGYMSSIINQAKSTKEIELMNKLLLEKEKQSINFQTGLNEMHLELSSLKKELDSLNNK